jgi:cell division protein FtsI (penicillin-binding protein 3)
MVRAVAAVANGGIMMKPQIVRRVIYDGRIFVHPPMSQGRVISAQTAQTLTDMLVRSAVGGEAQLGLVPHYNVAAKTGTANIAVNGVYVQGATIASIVGYAPAFHPRFVVLVKLDHPRDTPWGSMAAAPVLHNLLQELFRYYRIPPASNPIVK